MVPAMKTQIHLTELQQLYSQRWQNQVTVWLLALGSPVPLGLSLSLGVSGAPVALGVSGLMAWGALRTAQKLEELEAILWDYRDIADSRRQDNLFKEYGATGTLKASQGLSAYGLPWIPPVTEPAEAQEAPEAPSRLYDWGDFRRNRDRYPHLMILGKTGSGKTWLAERLLTLLGGNVIAVAPHWQQGDYTAAHWVVGAGRDYGSEVPLESVSLDGFLAGHGPQDVCTFIRALHTEMNRRYQLDPETQKRRGGPILNVVLDEFPAYGSLPGELVEEGSRERGESVRDLMGQLLLEARKVNIRLVVLAQGGEVKTLGLEGRGSLREQLTWIVLSGFIKGLDGVRNLPPGGVDLTRLDPEDREVLKGLDRPCVIEGQPADPSGLASVDLTPPSAQPWQGGGAGPETLGNLGNIPDLSQGLGNPARPDRVRGGAIRSQVSRFPEEVPMELLRAISVAVETGDQKTRTVKRIREELGWTRARALRLYEDVAKG